MNKKKNYTCNICNTAWECYVYNEFSIPFSICLYCIMDAETIVRKKNLKQEVCRLCDTNKECHEIKLSNNPINNKMFICNECFSKIKELMKK